MYQLPTFNGYTIDIRLGQFRKVGPGKNCDRTIEFIEFESEEGRAIIEEFLILATALDVVTREILKEREASQPLKERLRNTVAQVVTKIRGH